MKVSAMRHEYFRAAILSALLLSLNLLLAACGPAPERVYYPWTGGSGPYDDPSMYRSGGGR
jgi:hypothetical protein